MKIFKYVLGTVPKILENYLIELPKVHRVLSVGMQGLNVCIWAIVDETSPKVRCHFRIYYTGDVVDIDEEVCPRCKGLDGKYWTVDEEWVDVCPECENTSASIFLGRIDSPDGLVFHVFERVSNNQ